MSDEITRKVYFLNEMATVLGMSVRSIQKLRAAGAFPIEEVVLDKRPRWSRAVVRAYLNSPQGRSWLQSRRSFRRIA